jgi:hypothetical protein
MNEESVSTSKSTFRDLTMDDLGDLIKTFLRTRSLYDIGKHENLDSRIWLRINDLDSVNMI